MNSQPEPEISLFLNHDDGLQGKRIECGKGEIYQYSRPCPTRPDRNEDSSGMFLLNEGSRVLAVADGMGGMNSAAEASAIAMRSLKESFQNQKNSESECREAILSAIDAASARISSLKVGAGTTLAVVELIDEEKLRTYHVGDSEILVCGQRGKLKLQTISHAPVSYGVESGLIDEADAIFHDERHLISNYLGMPEMRVEIGNILELAERDTVLVASDGLCDNLQTEEIVQIIRKDSLDQAGAKLVQAIDERMRSSEANQPSKLDDVTFFLYRRL